MMVSLPKVIKKWINLAPIDLFFSSVERQDDAYAFAVIEIR
jgi:hypothetical protein